MRQLGVIADGAVAVKDGRIAAVGPTDRIAREYRAADELDLSGYVVLPGFVDSHTHPVFSRARENEFHQRVAGAVYMAIAAAGGGILSSMRALRETGVAELAEHTERRERGGSRARHRVAACVQADQAALVERGGRGHRHAVTHVSRAIESLLRCAGS